MKIEYVGQSASPLIRGSQWQNWNHCVIINNELIDFASCEDEELLREIRKSVRPEMRSCIDRRLNRKSPLAAI